jgi:hypothetical protein
MKIDERISKETIKVGSMLTTGVDSCKLKT